MVKSIEEKVAELAEIDRLEAQLKRELKVLDLAALALVIITAVFAAAVVLGS